MVMGFPIDRHFPHRIAVFLGALAVPIRAEASGACVAAMVDQVLPPVLAWSAFAIVWFLIVSAACTFHEQRLAGIPQLGGAVLLVFGLVILGSMFIGPIGVLMLLLPFPVVVLKPHFETDEAVLSRELRAALKPINIISLVCMAGLIGWSLSILQTRTPIEFLQKWENINPHVIRNQINQLTEAGPEALPDLRAIVERATKLSNRIVAAKRLAVIGDPEVDVPRLIGALEGCGDDPDCRTEIGTALGELSGIALPPATPAPVWRETWKGSRHEADPHQ